MKTQGTDEKCSSYQNFMLSKEFIILGALEWPFAAFTLNEILR